MAMGKEIITCDHCVVWFPDLLRINPRLSRKLPRVLRLILTGITEPSRAAAGLPFCRLPQTGGSGQISLVPATSKGYG